MGMMSLLRHVTTFTCVIAIVAAVALVRGQQVATFPAGMTWQNIAWCPSGHHSACQNIDLVLPWQQAVDVDLFDTPTTIISALISAGHTVICYFSAGSYEDWRPDASKFPKDVLRHRMDSWPGEWWLDIFNASHRAVIESIMFSRMQLGVQKGCQAFEADNVDCYSNGNCLLNLDNATGYADQLNYNKWLANTAHELGAAMGLKNDLGQVGDLVDIFDFHIDEQQCQQYDRNAKRCCLFSMQTRRYFKSSITARLSASVPI